MNGTEKQIAWAQKIIAYKTKGAKTCGIDEKEWNETVNWVSEKYGAKGWIEMRDDHPRDFVIEYKAAMIDEKETAEVTKPADLFQKKYEESVSEALDKSRKDDIQKQAEKQGLNPEIVLKTDEILHKIATAKPEQQKSIQILVISLIRDAANAAKRKNDKMAMELLTQADEMMMDITSNEIITKATKSE